MKTRWPTPGSLSLLPGLVPAAVAAILALIFAPSEAAPVAYVAAVAGPLIGADLLHLKEIFVLLAVSVSAPRGL